MKEREKRWHSKSTCSLEPPVEKPAYSIRPYQRDERKDYRYGKIVCYRNVYIPEGKHEMLGSGVNQQPNDDVENTFQQTLHLGLHDNLLSKSNPYTIITL
jgi:hypothetical protein